MKTTLEIKGLRVMTRIGIHDWEQAILQPILIDLCIPIALQAEVKDIHDVLDYDSLCKTLTTYLEVQSFKLIEALACAVVRLIQETWRVKKLTLTLHKPHAISHAQDIAIKIEVDD